MKWVLLEGSNCMLSASRWPVQATGVIGMIKPCQTGLGLEPSCLMTGCDSQVALKQNKLRWQFAVSSATVKIAVQKQMLWITTSKVCSLTTQMLMPEMSSQETPGYCPHLGHSAVMSRTVNLSCALHIVSFPYYNKAYFCKSTNQSSHNLHRGLILMC